MAQSRFVGHLRDFSDQPIEGARMWVHPTQPSGRLRGGRVFADKIIEVTLSDDGRFEVLLEQGHPYSIEVQWLDPDRSRVGRSWWSPPFRAPASTGDRLIDAMAIPPGNGLIQTIQGAPVANQHMSQYVLDQTTGDLYERTS